MVVYYRLPGGQSQSSALADLGGDGTAFSPLFDWIRGNLSQPLTVEDLAARVAMSPRNFSRAFTREVGVGPAKAVERLRLEAARERVENSTWSHHERSYGTALSKLPIRRSLLPAPKLFDGRPVALPDSRRSQLPLKL